MPNQKLFHEFESKEYCKDDVVLEARAEPRHIGFVEEGLIKGVMIPARYESFVRKTVCLAGDNDWFGSEVFAKESNIITHIALTDSIVTLFPYDWIFEHAPMELKNSLLVSLAIRNVRMISHSAVKFDSFELRIVHRLIELREIRLTPEIELTQNDLADLMGVDRSYLSRNMNRLRSMGIIEVNRGNLTVPDLKTLRSLLLSMLDNPSS